MLCEVIKTIYGKFKKSKKKYRAKLKIKSQSLTLSFFFVSLDKLYASICTESKTFYKVLFESLTAKVILPFRFNSIFLSFKCINFRKKKPNVWNKILYNVSRVCAVAD